VGKGKVKARVQGSQPRPYDVAIQIQELSAQDWGKVVQALAGQALFAAKLLAGEMPQEVEQVFTGAGLSLFPQKKGDLKTSCSCPDMSNPCKHIAAVYYLLGEEFDRDPFLLFKLRGLSREELVARLNEAGGAAAGEPAATAVAPAEPQPEALAADPRAFWDGGPIPEDLFGDVQPPPEAAAVLRRLGSFPFWRGREGFLEALEHVYRAAALRGLGAFLGEREG
jgi:uncharacterized Zn finger protein